MSTSDGFDAVLFVWRWRQCDTGQMGMAEPPLFVRGANGWTDIQVSSSVGYYYWVLVAIKQII